MKNSNIGLKIVGIIGFLMVWSALLTGLTFAEPYKDRQQKQEYIKEHGGHKSETGVRSGKYQVEFGDAHDYKDTFKRAEKNAGTRKPKVVIDAPKHKQNKIKSDARKNDIEVEFEDEEEE